jgi:hypothetical protein
LIQDDLSGRLLSTTGSDPAHQILAFDPGYYCLNVYSRSAQPVSFNIDLTPRSAGPFPSVTKDDATSPVSQFELGNLSYNGYYKIRYLYFQNYPPPLFPPNPPPMVLEPYHDYIVRDWVGNTAASQWYRFQLAQPGHIELQISNLYLGGGATIENASGVIGTATPSGSSLGGLLPGLAYSGNLPVGFYWVHISYNSAGAPGTPFELWLRAR